MSFAAICRLVDLHIMKGFIITIEGEERIMGAFFDDSAILDDDNAIGILNG